MATKTDPIPKGYDKPPCGTTPTIIIDTLGPAHLYLWVFNRLPTLTPRHVDHRGRRRSVRYKGVPEYYRCIGQLEAGETTLHTFTLPTLPIGSVVWLAYADSCNSKFSSWVSAPWQYTYVECDPSGGFCALYGMETGLLFPDPSRAIATNGTFSDGNPAMVASGAALKALVGGTYQVSVYGRARNGSGTTPPTCTIGMTLFRYGPAYLEFSATSCQVSGPSGEAGFSMSGLVSLVAGQSVGWAAYTLTDPGANRPTCPASGDLSYMALSLQT